MKIFAFDLGSTGLKTVVCDENGNVLQSVEKSVKTYINGGEGFQLTGEWLNLFEEAVRETEKREEIDVIIGTGQMEDLVKVCSGGIAEEKVSMYSSPVRNERMNECEQVKKIGEKSPNLPDPFMPLVKIFAEMDSESFEKTEKYIFGSKDFINYYLTGKSVTDHTNASTTGLLDFETLCWNSELPGTIGKKLPELSKPYEKIEILDKTVVGKLGFREDVMILNGIGDAGASTLGSGISCEGEANIYMGTTGWISTLSKEICRDRKMFSLFGMDSWMIIGPVLNAGNAYDWARKNLLGDESYDVADEAINKYKNTGVVCHPYLNGERSPFISPEIRADISNIGINTCKEEMFAAFARSLCFSLKHVLSVMSGGSITPVILNGGVANSSVWVQLLCDVLKTQIRVVQDQQLGPIHGLVDIVRKRFGLSPLKRAIKKNYRPNEETDYEKHFQVYLNSNRI